MSKTSQSGGPSGLMLGGAAATVVIVAGVVLMQLGLFDGGSTDSTSPANSPQAAAPEQSADPDGRVNSPAVAPSKTQPAPETTADTASAETATPETAPDAETVGGEASATELAATDTETAQLAALESTTSDSAAAATAETVETGQTDSADEAQPAEGAAPASTDAAAAAAPPADPEITLTAPELELVRVDPQGAAVIAGRAMGGADVMVLLDGEVLAETDVAGDGEFAILTDIPPSDQARVVSLIARLNGQEAASDAQFILAPAAQLPATAEVAAEDVAEAPSETGTAIATPKIAETASAPTKVGAATEPQTGTPTLSVETAESATGSARAQVAQGAEVTQTAETEAAPKPASQPVAVLKSGADGVELVQPASPVIANEVTLDTISYSDDGDVLLAGRGQPGAAVRIYLNNKAQLNFPVDATGRWGGTLAGVSAGVYTLRLDEINPETGKVFSRLETPFRREAPELLQLQTPVADSAADAPVQTVRAITVQEGDTLWAISQQRYGSGFLFVRVFEANQDAIRNPDLIYPGQVFNLPD